MYTTEKFNIKLFNVFIKLPFLRSGRARGAPAMSCRGGAERGAGEAAGRGWGWVSEERWLTKIRKSRESSALP